MDNRFDITVSKADLMKLLTAEINSSVLQSDDFEVVDFKISNQLNEYTISLGKKQPDTGAKSISSVG